MKAAQRTTYGYEEVISINEIEIPAPRESEILIKVHATTVSRTDCGVIAGAPFIFRFFTGLPNPKIATLGTDFAGEVVDLGSDITAYKKGDKIMGFLDVGLGTQAEYLCTTEKTPMMPIPESLDYATAAASMEAAHYASSFINKIDVKAGDEIMVNGGTGGIGSAAIQFLKQMGCHITATCRGEHVGQVKALGADVVIDYEKEDFTKQDKKYPLVFDAVGKSSFGACKNILTENGTYFSSELGPGAENLYLWPFTHFFGKQKMKMALPVAIPKSLDYISERIKEGSFTPLIDDKRYTLHEIKEAYKYVRSAQKVGNVILEMEAK